jgi:hypothetical protein
MTVRPQVQAGVAVLGTSLSLLPYSGSILDFPTLSCTFRHTALFHLSLSLPLSLHGNPFTAVNARVPAEMTSLPPSSLAPSPQEQGSPPFTSLA